MYRKKIHNLNKLILNLKSSKRFETLIPVIIYIVSHVVSLVLVYRSLPFLISLGFIKKAFVGISKILIPFSYVFYILSIINVTKKIKIKKSYIVFLIFVLITGIAIYFYYLIFDYIDNSHYPNYVFTKYYIYMPSLRLYANFQAISVVLTIILVWKEKLGLKNRKGFREGRIFSLLLMIFIIYLSTTIFSDLPGHIRDEITIYKKYIQKSTGFSEYPDLGNLKSSMNFISAITSDDSVIIHPTQSDTFPLIGNQPLIRHDLFPRTLVSAGLEDKYFAENIVGNNIYYILARSVNLKGEPVLFPDKKISAEELVILTKNSDIKKYYNVNYSPEYEKQLPDYEIGLVKIK